MTPILKSGTTVDSGAEGDVGVGAGMDAVVDPTHGLQGRAATGRRSALRVLPPLIILAVLAYLPYVAVELPGILPAGSAGRGVRPARRASSSPVSLAMTSSSGAPACSASATRSSSRPEAIC